MLALGEFFKTLIEVCWFFCFHVFKFLPTQWHVSLISKYVRLLIRSRSDFVGLRSRILSEQLATVVGTVPLLKANPSPNLVNAVIIRLADLFKDQLVASFVLFQDLFHGTDCFGYFFSKVTIDG